MALSKSKNAISILFYFYSKEILLHPTAPYCALELNVWEKKYPVHY